MRRSKQNNAATAPLNEFLDVGCNLDSIKSILLLDLIVDTIKLEHIALVLILLAHLSESKSQIYQLNLQEVLEVTGVVELLGDNFSGNRVISQDQEAWLLSDSRKCTVMVIKLQIAVLLQWLDRPAANGLFFEAPRPLLRSTLACFPLYTPTHVNNIFFLLFDSVVLINDFWKLIAATFGSCHCFAFKGVAACLVAALMERFGSF
jgi:hypothetical protein